MNLGVTMVFAIVAVILALSLKSKNPEYSTFISVAVCLVLLFICVSRMRVMLSGIEVLTDKIRMDSTYLVILVKLIGIAYICEFAASISKDAGYRLSCLESLRCWSCRFRFSCRSCRRYCR